MLTINELLKKAKKKLNEVSETPLLDAKIILMDLLNIDEISIIMNGNDLVKDDIEEVFFSKISERMDSKPVQYIVNEQEFMGYDFFVDDRVLIPRADTEILVEKIIECFKNNNEDIKILEIGSGSGAIAISLDLFLKNASVVSVDISDKALEVARMNNKILKANVKFLKSNIFEKVDKNELFDVIVSNPPYIENKEYETLAKSVKEYEPKSALIAKDNGLYFYNEIIDKAVEFLKKGGILAFEVGYSQSEKVKSEMQKKGYIDIEIIKDLKGINRVVVGRRGEKNVF